MNISGSWLRWLFRRSFFRPRLLSLVVVFTLNCPAWTVEVSVFTAVTDGNQVRVSDPDPKQDNVDSVSLFTFSILPDGEADPLAADAYAEAFASASIKEIGGRRIGIERITSGAGRVSDPGNNFAWSAFASGSPFCVTDQDEDDGPEADLVCDQEDRGNLAHIQFVIPRADPSAMGDDPGDVLAFPLEAQKLTTQGLSVSLNLDAFIEQEDPDTQQIIFSRLFRGTITLTPEGNLIETGDFENVPLFAVRTPDPILDAEVPPDTTAVAFVDNEFRTLPVTVKTGVEFNFSTNLYMSVGDPTPDDPTDDIPFSLPAATFSALNSGPAGGPLGAAATFETVAELLGSDMDMLEIVPLIPEPSTMALLVSALVVSLCIRRK